LKEYIRRIINVKLIVISLILGLVVSGCEILGIYLDDKSAKISNGLLFYAMRGVVWLIGSSAVIYLGIILAKKVAEDKNMLSGVFAKPNIYWIIIFVAWIPCFLAYFPGIYSYDGEPQLIQYLNSDFDNHHPIFHTLILGWCYDFGLFLQSKGINIEGLCFYSLIQMITLSFAYSRVVKFFLDRKVGRLPVIIITVYFAIFPVHPIMAVSTTKDTLFTAFFVLFIIELFKYSEKDEFDIGVKDIKLFLIALLAMLFRRNGYYVVLLGLLVYLSIVLVRLIKKNSIRAHSFAKTVIILLVSVLVFMGTEKLLIISTDAAKGESAEALNIPLQQIARAYKNNEQQIREEFGEQLDRFIAQEGLANYRPYITDGVKMWFNNDYFNEHKGEFFKLYLNIGKEYISDYMTAALYLTRGNWYLTDYSHCEVYRDWWRDRTGYMITDATPVFALEYVKKSNLLPTVRNLYESIVTDMEYRNIFILLILFSPALYVFLTLFSGVGLLVRGRTGYLPAFLCVFIYFLTVFAGPCVLVRYIYPFMALIPILLILTFGPRRRINE